MSLSRLMLAGGTALMVSFPANAQSMQPMDHGSMPGMPMSKKPAKQPPKPSGEMSDHGTEHKPESGAGPVRPAAECTAEHARMGHCIPAADPAEPAKPAEAGADDGMAGMVMEGQPTGASPSDPDCPPEHAKMGHCTPKAASPVSAVQSQSVLGTDLEPGNAPAPSAPSDWYADRVYSSAEMARAREEMMKESGGTSVAFASFDLAEYVVHKNKDSYRWDGEAWLGGDINRFVFKYEGEGEFRGPLDDLELSALYSRAIDPYWNLQAGIRYDPKPDPSRTYAVIAVEGLAPYWFEVTASAFLSNKGEFRFRLEGYHDVRLTQKLILQPRLEANFSAQTIPELGVGSGLSNLELGARLRYEIKKEFAPYIGFEWIRQFGDSARFTRANGGQVSDPHFVMGVRLWF